jgi:hypothetical protein
MENEIDWLKVMVCFFGLWCAGLLSMISWTLQKILWNLEGKEPEPAKPTREIQGTA